MTMQRIAVVGTTGTGKTMLASWLSRRLGIPHVELDAIYWGPGWSVVPAPVFRARVGQALESERGVVDGNYSQVRDLVWGRAQALLWLDYALPVVMWRLVGRTLRTAVTGEELWSGNRERLATALWSRDSLLLWALKTYRKHRREYPGLLGEPEYAHLRLVRLRSPQATRTWLSGFEARRAW